MQTKRIPLAGSILTRDPINYAGRDQQFTNCFSYSEQDDATGGKRIYTEKRRGFASVISLGSQTASLGACIWQSNTTPQLAFSFVKSSGTEVQVFNQNATQIGADIATTNSCLSIIDTSVSGTGNLVAVLTDSGTNALEGWYFPQGGAWTQITDGDFPTFVGSPVALDGYLFWMTPTGQVWNSDLNSISSYTATNFITASSMPDGGVGLARTQDFIVAFGTYSIEFFQNAGNPTGSPLRAVPNSVRRIGAFANTIKTIGDVTYFTGINVETGIIGVYAVSGMEIKKISSHSVDQNIANAGTNYCYGSIKQSGFEHILFGSGVTGGLTKWVYQGGRWWKFVTGAANLTSSLSLGDVITYLAGDSRLLKVDESTSVYLDMGVATTMTIQTLPVDMGTDKVKFWNGLRLVGDKQSSACTVTVSYSDDDAINFTTAGTIDMSTNQVELNGLGSSSRRVWKFANSGDVPLRLEAMELDYTVGTR